MAASKRKTPPAPCGYCLCGPDGKLYAETLAAVRAAVRFPDGTRVVDWTLRDGWRLVRAKLVEVPDAR